LALIVEPHLSFSPLFAALLTAGAFSRSRDHHAVYFLAS